jgi:hypothetical protein
LDDAYLALAGTVFGGVGLKVVEQILGRTGRKDDTAFKFRDELRIEINSMRTEMDKLRTEIHKLDGELDGWRSRYFSLVSAVATGDQAAIKKHLS